MVTQLQSPDKSNIIYPDDNGEPMSNNTDQFRLIVWIKENLELLFANDQNVFVAGDLLWYPVEGNNKLCQAPDVMAVFGIPKGYRGSYQQWNEDNIAPQVAFEILPGDRIGSVRRSKNSNSTNATVWKNTISTIRKHWNWEDGCGLSHN